VFLIWDVKKDILNWTVTEIISRLLLILFVNIFWYYYRSPIHTYKVSSW
jgi:hypothetical protein